MATRDRRLAEFDGIGEPESNTAVQILCEDNRGTYMAPFLCVRRDGRWVNDMTGAVIDVAVIGWRIPRAT
jgi:hypothetical protein